MSLQQILKDIVWNFLLCLEGEFTMCPAGIYLFKVNNGNTRTVLNMFKVKNKDTRTTLLTSLCFY